MLPTTVNVWYGQGMVEVCEGAPVAVGGWVLAARSLVEVCEGAPVAVSGWVLTDRHDLAPCAANSLHRGTMN